jgi:transcriptional regulator with XRE-family HTH domain
MDEPELLDEKQLLRRAQQAFQRTKGSQRDVARALGLNRSSVSRALRNEDLKHAAVQARLVSLLEETAVQRRSAYRGADVKHESIVGPWNPEFRPQPTREKQNRYTVYRSCCLN